MAHRLLKSTSILGSLVGEYGLSGMNLVQGYDVLLDYFDRNRFGCRKVPDLLALGLCLLESPGNGSGVHIFVGLAQVEALGNDFARALAGGLLAYEDSLGGGY